MSNLVLTIIFAVLMLPGIVLVFIPMVPSVSGMLLLAVIFALITKFSLLSGGELAILALIYIASVAVDYLSGLAGAALGGASVRSIWAGMIGMTIGIFIFPPFGVFVGLFLGVLYSEFLRKGEVRGAIRAATGSVLGSLSGMVINCILAIALIVLFILFSLL